MNSRKISSAIVLAIGAIALVGCSHPQNTPAGLTPAAADAAIQKVQADPNLPQGAKDQQIARIKADTQK